jgi:hypothetical protein
LRYKPPLRLLGITACPSGQDELDIEKEKGYINTALNGLTQKSRVEIEWKRAEPGVLRDLKFDGPYQVLHFIGHGYFDGKMQEGKIVFEDVKGNKVDYDAHRLSLALHRDMQLVFLNACDTARGAPLDYLSNFAYKLAVSGIPAIVAMQLKITDDAAIQFARAFYESIADGDAVDEAVTKARHHIYVGTNASSLLWIAPLLYISTSNSISFRVVNERPPLDPQLNQPPVSEPARPLPQGRRPSALVLARLLELGRGFRQRVSSFPLWIRIVAVVVILALVVAGSVGATWPVDGGGLDLGAYCQSLDYMDLQKGQNAYSWQCIHPMSQQTIWTKVCNWQYKRRDLVAEETVSSSGVWSCYIKGTDTNFGGASDLLGYCRQAKSHSTIKCAEPSSELKIDIAQACQWKWQRDDVWAYTSDPSDPVSWRCQVRAVVALLYKPKF